MKIQDIDIFLPNNDHKTSHLQDVDTFRVKIRLSCCNRDKSHFLNSKGQEEPSQTPLFGKKMENGRDI